MDTTRVLVGLDGSEAARRAFRVAIEEALWRQATVCALHVVFVPMVMGRTLSFEIAENVIDYGNLVMDRELDLLRDEYGGEFPVEVERRVRSGHIGRELVVATSDRDLGIELVVVGTRGLGGFTSLVLGSVSTYAIQHLDVPVLVVPDLPESSSDEAAREVFELVDL